MTEVATQQRKTVDRMQVRIDHLDTLLGLAGEVIITSANLQDLERRANSAAGRSESLGQDALQLIKASNESTRRISQDLHDLVMAIRLVEIRDIYRLLRRPVRDLGRNLGRDIELVFAGEDVMIDKALSERLVDPLLHLLRNAVDHGIEPPLERNRAGKPTTGTVTVAARDLEQLTEITVRDDGAGIDVEAVRAAGGEAAARLPLLDLLCRPGLTTASEVTATSGRGVGLDLVRTVAEEFDGELACETAPGQGTTFTLRIPKLRAVNIVDALTLRAGDTRFALPIEQITASLGVRREDIRTTFDRARHFLHQDHVVPLHDLQELLGNPPLAEDRDPLPVVIVQSKYGQIALVVSEFLGPQKLVNIPLEEGMQHDPGVGGTAVFTGGALGLTVDVDALVAHATGADQAVAATVETAAARTGDSASDPSRDGARPRTDAGPRPEPVETGLGLDSPEAAAMAEELTQGLQTLQEALLNLESAPDQDDHLHAAFRRLHAAKGHFTMLEMAPAAEMAHHLETVLDYLRAGRLAVTHERMDLLLDGVGYLQAAARSTPPAPAPPTELVEALNALVAPRTVEAESSSGVADVLAQPFALGPSQQLQVLSALKRGERTYETYLAFDAFRQPDFLAAYLLLRRIGKSGTVLATLPSVAEIEQGLCGPEVKVLWSTPQDQDEVTDQFDRLARLYNLREHRTIPTTIFRYEQGG